MSYFELLMKILNFYRLARQSFALGSGVVIFCRRQSTKNPEASSTTNLSSRQITDGSIYIMLSK